MREASFEKAPGFVALGPKDYAAYTGEYCFDLNGTHFCRAGSLACATMPIDDGPTWVMVALALAPNGLHLPMTPEGEREFAQGIMRAADEADATNAASANAQLAATLAKKG